MQSFMRPNVLAHTGFLGYCVGLVFLAFLVREIEIERGRERERERDREIERDRERDRER